MALKRKTLKKITVLTRRFIAYMKYMSIGPHVLTKRELKDLVRSGQITSTKAPKTAISQVYNKTHGDLAELSAPKTHREGSIDFLERMFERYADKAGQQLETDILGEIESQIMPFVDRQEGKHIYDLLRDKDIHKKYLGRALKDRVENWQNRWKVIVNTELARASNFGAVDAIFENNKDKSPDEVYVYKTGPHDGATCEYCYRFWFMSDRTTPRVYTMAELIANGSNIGRKQSEWLPTIDLTHPNGRHLLVEIRPGFGFDKTGGLQYISKDYDERRKQRGF